MDPLDKMALTGGLQSLMTLKQGQGELVRLDDTVV